MNKMILAAANRHMRKIFISALAVAPILTVATAANAGYWWRGVYYIWCGYNSYGQWVCY